MRVYDLPDSKVSLMGEYLPAMLELSEGEKILYVVVTKDFSGNMLFAFENGKAAKVALSNYETKTNRRKLVGAYSDKSPVCAIMYLPEETDVVAFSDNKKVLCFNTEKVPLKATKSTQGVQVMTLRKKGSKMAALTRAEDSGLQAPERYRSKNIPAAGSFLKDGDNGAEQLSLE